MENISSEQKIKDILKAVIASRSLKFIVLSKPCDNSIVKSRASLFLKGDEVFLQIESFTSDNKALHKNIKEDEAADVLYREISENYRQTNIFTYDGECEILISKKGKISVLNKIRTESEKHELSSHDRKKEYILDTEKAYPFLCKLGISDENGSIYDKKRSKYKQINKFLDAVETVYPELPQSGTLSVYDFCCGKSYLTFALYFYLRDIMERDVRIYGIDLKSDCIKYCSETASELGFDGMSFECADILKYEPPTVPDMTVSLHACDIATDIALGKAVMCGAKVILATPCCHHEMFHQMKNGNMGFITKYSMLKQKLCDTVTDALRAKMLEIKGYKVTVSELIDPEETPKNLLIRAIYDKVPNDAEKQLREYRDICSDFGINPFLYSLLYDSDNK